MSLADKLNALRDRHGMTYQQLSDSSGVPVGTLKSILTGTTANPGFDTVCAILRAMGESADALSGTVPAAEPPPPNINDRLLEQAVTVAAQAATLDARNESIDRTRKRVDQLEAELADERRQTRRMQIALVLLVAAFFLLAAIYIWDVRNLHSGLTAYFNS